jgi:hypothetical protein
MDDRYHSSPRDGAHVRLIHSSVRLTVAVENVGDVLLRLEESLVGIQQVMPLPEHLQSALLAGDKNPEIKWPFVDTRRQNRSGSEIESGESAAFDFELFVPRTIRFVIVYTYFRNITKPKAQGWNTSTLYELQNTET